LPDEDGGDGGGRGHDGSADLGAYSKGVAEARCWFRASGVISSQPPTQSGHKSEELLCHGQI
jgi:hypothetical protein